jgi:hypothetical protein
MVDSIKITALQDIGANIAYTTLVPVVNMAGTPTTQKANLQNLGNLILNGAGGSYFARAAQANIALSVANAAQPNITSLGNLTSLRVTGNITAANINGGNLVVANFFSGDGGFLTNVAGSGSNYSNSNVANYLPTFTGNVGASNVNVTGTVYVNAIRSTTGNITVNTETGFGNWTFTNQGKLIWPSNIGEIDTNNGIFEIHSSNGFQISTNEGNASQSFIFDTDGSVYCPANAYFEGTRLNVGPGAGNVTLTNPTLVVSDTGGEFIQAAILNENSNGSSDYAAYGADSDETHGFADLGFAGHTFNDPNYTITLPGDGYVFAQGYANGIGGGLVLATGESGNVPDIIFATGGFMANNEFARMSDSTNTFEMSRANSTVVSTRVTTTPVTVSALPSAATAGAGARAFVTDANSITFNASAVGGGGTNMPVFSNGTGWFIG